MMTTTNAPRPSGRHAARCAALCLLALLALLCRAQDARAQWTTSGTNTTTTDNVGVGTSTPTYSVTVVKDQPSPTAVAVFNRADGASAQAAMVVSRTLDFSSKYMSFGVTAPGFTGPGFSDTAYIHSAGFPMKVGSETANDLQFFTNGITNTRMTITGSGNVGIGTQSPATAKLVISGTAGTVGLDMSSTDQYAEMRVIRNSLNPGDKDLYLQWMAGAGSKTHFYSDNAETMTLNAGNVGIGTAAPASKLHVAGNITVDGNINAKYQDVAEWVPSTQKLAAGVVVVLDTRNSNHVLASAKSYDTRVAGVVSAQPGLTLGEAGEGKALVATTGRVKVKVDASRAPIQIGDLLVTSDVEGVAMRSEPVNIGGRQFHSPGTIIGKALEPLEKGTGEILVLLSLQ